PDDEFDIHDYPRKGYIRYKKMHEENPCIVARAEFELSEGEVAEIEANFGAGVLSSNKVVVGKNYKNERHWQVELSESSAIEARSDNGTTNFASVPSSFQNGSNSLPQESSKVDSLVASKIAEDFLEKWLPKFVYFDNYSLMRGKISINELKKRTEEVGTLDDSDRTFMSLLTLSGVSLEDLEEDLSYEDIKVELESASITITDEIFEYWQQNRQLKVEFDLSQADSNNPAEGKILHVRIEN
ncbi:uncharacterized protein METZ01_LOCUS482540, partial [marine metagenome]